MSFGAAEDVVRAPDLVTAKAKMTLLRLAGFSSVRVTSQWLPGQVAPPETELQILRNVAAAAQLLGRQGLPLRVPAGLALDAAHAGGARGVRRLRDRADAAAAVGRRRDRRQRAEPEPVLAAAVQPRRHRRRRACVPGAARPLLRRAQGRRPGRSRVWGGALAPRGHRPAGHAAATPIRRSRSCKDMGAAYRASGRARCRSWTGSPSTPTPTRPASRPTHRTRSRRRSASPTTTASSRRSGQAFDGTPQAGSSLPAPLRRVRRRVADPGRQGEGVHRHGAGDDEAGRRDHPGRSSTDAPCSSRSASRTSSASSSSTPRTSRRSRAGSRASTTPTGRRSRASTPSVTRSPAPAAARSPAATGSRSTSLRRKVRFPTQAELTRGTRDVRFTCALDCAWELRVVGCADGRHRAPA